MFQKVTSLFRKENPEGDVKFDHSKLTQADPSQCPFMKKKTEQKGECPYKNNNSKQATKKQVDSDSEEQEKPKGGCPFMGTSTKKRNPGLNVQHSAFDEPFVSKYKYYLSANKLDFSIMSKGKNKIRREVFNKYPIYLQHTLFFNGEDFQKVRKLECCSRFLAYEQMREKGNKYFNKGKFAKSLDYYERAMSLFRWLEYKEQEKSMAEQKSEVSEIQSMQSIESDISKIPLNLQQQTPSKQSVLEEKNKEIDEMRDKYKQFFVVYHDENVGYFNGEQLEEDAEIDMRKSLLIQIYINMASAYMNLNHFSLAERVIDDAFELTERVSQAYLRKAQSLILRKNCTLSQAQQAKRLIIKAIEMKPNEKIFSQSNANILKMLNLGDVDQVYAKCLETVNSRIEQISQKLQKMTHKIYERAVEINEIEKQMIAEGKTPKQSHNQETLHNNSEYKILQRMIEKYVRVIDFYTEAQKPDQVELAKREFQQVLRVSAEVETIFDIQVKENNAQLGGLETEKIQKRIQRIKTRNASDIYNEGKYNFHVLEWAIKQIVKEENQQRKQKAKAEREQSGEQMENEIVEQKNWLKKLGPLLLLIPVLIILINFYLL